MLTVYRQIDPRPVDRVISRRIVKKDDGAFVPAGVGRPQVRYLDGSLLDEPDAALVAGSDVWRIAVELDEHWHLFDYSVQYHY